MSIQHQKNGPSRAGQLVGGRSVHIPAADYVQSDRSPLHGRAGFSKVTWPLCFARLRSRRFSFRPRDPILLPGVTCRGARLRRTSAARHDPPCDRAVTILQGAPVGKLLTESFGGSIPPTRANLPAPLSRAEALAKHVTRQAADAAPFGQERHSSLPVANAQPCSERIIGSAQKSLGVYQNDDC